METNVTKGDQLDQRDHRVARAHPAHILLPDNVIDDDEQPANEQHTFSGACRSSKPSFGPVAAGILVEVTPSCNLLFTMPYDIMVQLPYLARAPSGDM